MPTEFLDRLIDIMGPAGLAFVCFIILLLLWAIAHYLVPVFGVANTIRKASRRIAAHDSGLENAFNGAGQHLAGLWSSFLKERRRTRVTDNASPTSPEHWFQPGSVLPTYNRSAALALAGAFAGLGILGTFVGLLTGLVNIDTGEGQVLGSVTSFIGGMSTAFWSSIFGIGASLVWLALDRGTYNHLLVRLRELHSVIRHRLPTVDAEELLGLLLSRQQDSLELQRSQKAILQNLGTDISAAFEEAMKQTLTPAMTQISASLEAMSTHVSDQQAEALGLMAQKFQQELMGGMSEQFRSLADSVQAAADYQAKVNDDVSELFETLVSATDGQIRLIEETKRASETFSSSMQALGEMQDRLAQVAERMSNVTEQLDSLSDGLTAQTREYRDAQHSVQELLAAQLDASASQVAELNDFFTDLSGDLQRLSDNLERSITEFSGLATDKLGEVFNRFDTELSTVVDHLSGTLAQIRDVTEDFPRALEDLRGVISEASEPLRSLDGRVESAVGAIDSFERLSGVAESLSEELKRSSGTLSRLEQQLDSSFLPYAGGRPDSSSGARRSDEQQTSTDQ